MNELVDNGDRPLLSDDPLDADLCDVLIDQFRARIYALQREATEVRQEFDRLHSRWLAHIETRNGMRDT